MAVCNNLLFLILLSFAAYFFAFSRAESSKFEEYEKKLPWQDIEAENEDDQVRYMAQTTNYSSVATCDLTKGKWINDQTYPLYDATRCPYLSSAVACQENGRPDSGYEKWRWQPDGCSIPRFDALDFLGKMRRKRVMLVGDSIMRNQWESLVCLIQSVVPTARKTVIYNGPTMAFLALDYELSIEFCWAPFLVELRKGADGKRVLHLDLIEANAKYWRGVDVLVFDSARWWAHSEKQRSWDFVMEGNSVYNDVNPPVAYERGLRTWATWIELNLDPARTRVFFRSVSPGHNRGNGFKCNDQKEPLENLSRPEIPGQSVVLQKVVKGMEFPVYVQDITAMSALRRDGHPSVYGRGRTNKQKSKEIKSDCSHWCLPGVPDTWNELLSAMV